MPRVEKRDGDYHYIREPFYAQNTPETFLDKLVTSFMQSYESLNLLLLSSNVGIDASYVGMYTAILVYYTIGFFKLYQNHGRAKLKAP
jgi:hypothetical protein